MGFALICPVVRADEMLTAFMELESAIREASGKLSCDLNRTGENISRLQNSYRV